MLIKGIQKLYQIKETRQPISDPENHKGQECKTLFSFIFPQIAESQLWVASWERTEKIFWVSCSFHERETHISTLQLQGQIIWKAFSPFEYFHNSSKIKMKLLFNLWSLDTWFFIWQVTVFILTGSYIQDLSQDIK